MGRKRKQAKWVKGWEHWRCSTCDEWVPRYEMGIRRKAWNGLDHHCKPCLSVRRKKQWRDNLEHNRALSRASTGRFHEKHPEYVVNYYKENKEEILARDKERYWANADDRRAQMRQWQANNREHKKAYKKEYKKRFPDRYRAHKIINGMVQRGTMVKPSHCECCGTETTAEKLHGHHRDYSNPHDVIWLCRMCHEKEH